MQDKIRNILLKALKRVDYQKIVLFGSRVDGGYTEENDYDFLIVLNGCADIKIKKRISKEVRVFFLKK